MCDKSLLHQTRTGCMKQQTSSARCCCHCWSSGRVAVRKNGAAPAFSEILLLSMTSLLGYHKPTLEAIALWDSATLDM